TPLGAVPVLYQWVERGAGPICVKSNRPHIGGRDYRYRQELVVAGGLIGGGHNTPLGAVPVLCQRLVSRRTEVIADRPHIAGRDYRHRCERIGARALIWAGYNTPLRAVPVFCQRPRIECRIRGVLANAPYIGGRDCRYRFE